MPKFIMKSVWEKWSFEAYHQKIEIEIVNAFDNVRGIKMFLFQM